MHRVSTRNREQINSMKINPYIRFNDRWLRIIGIPLLGVLVPVIFFRFRFEGTWIENLMQIVISSVYTGLYWEGNRHIMIFFRKRFPEFADAKKRIVRQSAAMLVFTLVFCYVIDYVLELLIGGNPLQPDWIEKNAASLVATITVASVYETFYYFRELKNSLTEKEELKRENIQAQLETLKNQVNPHFLFNSLNTLAAIIPEDKDLSVDFVQKLSKVYRYILEIKDLELIDLREELNFIQSYIFLQKIRFGENLVVNVNIPEDMHSNKVVPLSLQILLENAIKHNIISAEKPLHIDVFLQNDKILVRNNLQKKSQPETSTKTGLQNITSRYKLLTNQLVETIVTTTYFMVALPLIKPAQS